MKICNFMKNFYFPTIMTASSWCLVNADLKTWDRGKKENNKFFRACLPRNAAAKLALSIVLSPPLLSFLGGPVLLFYAMIT